MGSDSNNSNASSFDTNMVIILAALLSALICALGLNSIVRCAFQCGGRLLAGPGEAAPADLERLPLRLRKSTLRRIPVSAYSGEGPERRLHTECTVCLAEFEDGQKVRVLPRCGHGFHVACIDPWLVSHSSCPTCRQSLLPEVAPAAAAAQSGGAVGGGGDPAVVIDEVA